jgi:hypothetical protein
MREEFSLTHHLKMEGDHLLGTKSIQSVQVQIIFLKTENCEWESHLGTSKGSFTLQVELSHAEPDWTEPIE